MSKFIEVYDDSGIVTVVRVEKDGFLTMHASLFNEFVERGGYRTEGAE